MITDEGASFLSDLKRYETKHESYISLLNQLFDGKGDKMTLAKKCGAPSSAECNLTQYRRTAEVVLRRLVWSNRNTVVRQWFW